jgi:hypothetical protein
MEGTAEEIQKQIEQRLNELPADVRTAVLSSDFGEKIRLVGEAYKLHIDQAQELSDFTMLMMLGFMNEDEYRKEITGVVAGDAGTAQKIVADVNAQVFLPIRESLKAFTAGQAAPTPAPVAPVMQATPTPTNAPAPAPLPVKAAEIHPADVMLTQKTITTMPAAPAPKVPSTPAAPAKPIEQKIEPPKPQDYKADPYREPIQ